MTGVARVHGVSRPSLAIAEPRWLRKVAADLDLALESCDDRSKRDPVRRERGSHARRWRYRKRRSCRNETVHGRDSNGAALDRAIVEPPNNSEVAVDLPADRRRARPRGLTRTASRDGPNFTLCFIRNFTPEQGFLSLCIYSTANAAIREWLEYV